MIGLYWVASVLHMAVKKGYVSCFRSALLTIKTEKSNQVGLLAKPADCDVGCCNCGVEDRCTRSYREPDVNTEQCCSWNPNATFDKAYASLKNNLCCCIFSEKTAARGDEKRWNL
jgi:hypothetical protein